MAPKRDLAKIGSEGFALIDEYFDKERTNRAAATGVATTFQVPHQSCNYRYIIPESLVYRMIPSTITKTIVTSPTPPVSALNSYEAAQSHDGIHLTSCSKRRQMRMAY